MGALPSRPFVSNAALGIAGDLRFLPVIASQRLVRTIVVDDASKMSCWRYDRRRVVVVRSLKVGPNPGVV